MTTAPALKTGDLVRLPGSRTAVVESVSLDGSWFTTTRGGTYFTDEAEVVPLGSPATGKAA